MSTEDRMSEPRNPPKGHGGQARSLAKLVTTIHDWGLTASQLDVLETAFSVRGLGALSDDLRHALLEDLGSRGLSPGRSAYKVREYPNQRLTLRLIQSRDGDDERRD